VDVDTASLRRQVDEATARLAATVAGLTDDDAGQPSALPGWTRGHLLTHVARNADGLRNLLIWARTGVETPQYPNREVRDADIEAGAGRSAAALLADLRSSAGAFDAEAAALSGPAWQVAVRGLFGPDHPAWFTLVRRLTEVEVHHVDLDAGFGPGDWPASFVAAQLPRTVADFAHRPDVPACRIQVTGAAAAGASAVGVFVIGAAGPDHAPRTVSGTGPAVLAWLTGRSGGSGLAVEPAGGVPRLPPWAPNSGGGNTRG
jgi:maleylpyruvate isomerase